MSCQLGHTGCWSISGAMQRRLAVILAADAVGYSHLMGFDEERAHRALRARHATIERIVARHGGRTFGIAGDAIMAEFASAVEAVRAAVETQNALADEPLDLPDGHRMLFRIGINLGDVIVDGANLYGDAVNLAARLEGLAEPGGVCISASVYEHVVQQLPLEFRDIGTHPVKNIAKPVHAYHVGMRSADDKLLSVTSVETFATNWLAPRLAEFQNDYPGIIVRLEAMGRVVDFERDGFDVGIRSGRGTWPGLNAHELLPIEFTPLCSPDLLKRAGDVTTPADLLRLPLFDDREGWWQQWFALAGAADVKLTHYPSFQVITQAMLAQAVLAGHGVAILMPFLFASEIAAGRMVQPFDLVCRSELSYWLVYPEPYENIAKVQAFKQWLLQQIQASLNSRP
jgi:class 3 adenylate cyclase/DNA-binding transcriptional LysR family regulator